ncbi:MAG TPA: hypothetical protein VFA59_16075 [Vicinamibacterales bacterium]|nr:hypothetical protein [Vicinamibacterales bacterium]
MSTILLELVGVLIAGFVVWELIAPWRHSRIARKQRERQKAEAGE